MSHKQNISDKVKLSSSHMNNAMVIKIFIYITAKTKKKLLSTSAL